MPSIEIVCLAQSQPTLFPDLPFAVTSETKLVSHRGRSSLFQRDFDRVSGCIYHLGNPALKAPDAKGFYFAADLLLEWWERVEFKPEYVAPVRALLEELLRVSPTGRLLFTSDYQFGPRPRRRYTKARTLEQFWALHAAKQLQMNALYVISDRGI